MADRTAPSAPRLPGLADDVLAAPRRRQLPVVEAAVGLVVTERTSRFTGAIAAVSGGRVALRDWRDRERWFPLDVAFAVDERPVRLVAPARAAPAQAAPSRTASGSLAVAAAPRVARAGRILVEGLHDAELVERVWGDDLRVEGVVVEVLDGVDHLDAAVAAHGPGPGRRLGVLVDHLVGGSKEARVAAAMAGPSVLVTGHPYVDVWQAVRPKVLGIAAWPDVPPGKPWKEGVCAAIGPALGATDPPSLWRAILRRVRSYADLEPPLVGAVEQLIDFVTADG